LGAWGVWGGFDWFWGGFCNSFGALEASRTLEGWGFGGFWGVWGSSEDPGGGWEGAHLQEEGAWDPPFQESTRNSKAMNLNQFKSRRGAHL
jgi:hypothetical protein